MKISTKGRYAILILVDIAQHGENAERVAEGYCGAPKAFRKNIWSRLRRCYAKPECFAASADRRGDTGSLKILPS